MTKERFVIIFNGFHEFLVKDLVENNTYGMFDRFEEPQMRRLVDDLNKLIK